MPPPPPLKHPKNNNKKTKTNKQTNNKQQQKPHLVYTTGWNKKLFNGSTMNDWSDNPSYHEQMLCPRATLALLSGTSKEKTYHSLAFTDSENHY